jgi:hypothetical protein
LLVYVDDGLILAKKRAFIEEVLAFLEKKCEIKAHEPTTFIGFEIHKQNGIILVNQQGYVKNLLERFQMLECKPASVPMQDNDLLPCEQPNPSLPYQQLVGALIFLSNLTRPDISFAVSRLAQFMNSYNETHWAAAKHVLRYLKGTCDLGLRYEPAQDFALSGYSDSDYAGCKIHRKSTGGFMFFLGKGLISWSSQKQPIIALSSTEAEYIALASAARESIWLRRFLNEIGLEQSGPSEIRVDNQSAIKLAHNPEFHKRSKHIEVKYHFTRELVEKKEINVKYVPTTEQLADILTKPLQKAKQQDMLKQIGIASEIDRGKAAEEAKVKQKRAFKMGNLMLISTLALLLATVQAINTKNSQPVLWRQSDTQITTGHYDVHLLIKLVSPCELLSNETVHHDVLPLALKRCEDIYESLFMAEIENMCFARNYTEVTIQKRGVWLAGLAVGSVVVTAGIATTGLVIGVSNKYDIGTLRWEMAEAERKIDRLDTKIQHIEKAIEEFKSDLVGVVKQLETHEMDFDLFKERFASTNFAISYITGRMLIGNQILKEAARKWSRNQLYPGMMDFFNITLPCGKICPLEFAKPKNCQLSHDRTKLMLSFVTPLINDTMKLLEPDPFTLMHQTDNKTCSIRYVGPQNAIVSVTDGCVYSMSQRHAPKDLVFSPNEGCRPANSFRSTTNYFAVDRCWPKNKNDAVDFIQVKPSYGQYHIYCFGNNVTIGTSSQPCPNQTFLLPITSTFKINSYEIRGNQVSYEHLSEPDPLFSLHANWNLQPDLHLEEIIKSLEAIDLNDNDDIHSYYLAVNLWMGLAIGLVIAVVMSIVGYFVWRKFQRRRAQQEQRGEEIEMTISPATARREHDTPTRD